MNGVDRAGPSSLLDASVIIPLQDTRGWAEACMRGWCERQTHPRERYEVIVVGDGSDPRTECSLARWMESHDSLVRRVGTRNEFEQFNVGAECARGRFLVFTEMHCSPEPRCLEALLGRLASGEVVGARCRSVGVPSHWLGRLEQKVFEEAIELAEAPEDWRKVLVHGFIVGRGLFQEWGGFEHEYGNFAGLLMAARLHRAGLALGVASEAAVRHHYTGDLRELYDYIESFSVGELRFLLEAGTDSWSRYFDCPPELLECLPEHAPIGRAALGARLKRAMARLRLVQHRWLVRIWARNPGRCERAYRAFWTDIIHYSRLAEIHRLRQPGSS